MVLSFAAGSCESEGKNRRISQHTFPRERSDHFFFSSDLVGQTHVSSDRVIQNQEHEIGPSYRHTQEIGPIFFSSDLSIENQKAMIG